MIIKTDKSATKSYTALILSMFSNLQIEKADTTLYQIPIKYGYSSRLYKKLNSVSESITYRVPIMSLIDTADTVNLDRAQNRLIKRAKVQNPDGLTSNVSYNTLPYDYMYELTLISDTMTTASAIKEAILYKFHNNTTYVDYVSFLGEVISTPVILNSVDLNYENNESDYMDDRLIEIKFTLTVEGILDTPIYNTTTKITEIDLLLKEYDKSVEAIIEQYKI